MKIGDRVRYRGQPELGTVESLTDGEWGIRWDDHAARGYDDDKLDRFSDAAARLLLEAVADGSSKALPEKAAPPREDPAGFVSADAPARAFSAGHNDALDACLVLVESKMDRNRVIICIKAMREHRT